MYLYIYIYIYIYTAHTMYMLKGISREAMWGVCFKPFVGARAR